MSRDGYSSPSYGRSGDRDGFQPLNRGDAAIDIPLQDINAYNGGGGGSVINRKASKSAGQRSGFFHNRKAGVRKSVLFSEGQSGYGSEEDKITAAGKLYNRILNFSVLTRYFIYILPLAAVLSVPIAIGATVAEDADIGGIRMIWVFIWLLCSWVGLWVSKVVAHYLPFIFRTVVGVINSGTRSYFLILRNLEIPLSLVGWALVSLATFKPIMTRNPTARASNAPAPHWVDIVQQILAAALISTGVYAGERLFIQVITISYHRKQFHAKIKDQKRILHLLALMYEASTSMFRSYCPEFAEEDAVINDILDLSFGRKKKQSRFHHYRSGSSTPARVLQEIGHLGDKVTAAFGNTLAEVTGKHVINAHTHQAVVVKALEKNASSEALARRIWLSFVIEGRDALYMEDIAEVLGSGHQAEAEECFAMLDSDGNGDISLDEMILTVTQFGRDRSSIWTSMHDVDQAIKVLDGMLCVVLFVVVVFIFIAFLNSSFVTTLATAGTALLSLSFVFSATCQEILGSCIFIFVKHPYDVGDAVTLNYGTDRLVVEHMSLLFTVFRRIDNHRTVQIPNIVLNNYWVENVSRSSAMKEIVSMFVHFDTSLADIQLLRTEMKKFVTDKDNSRDFQPDIDIEVLGIHEMDKLEITVEIRHKSNWSNETVRAARRSKFMCALVLALRKVPIYGPGGGDAGLGTSDNPSYSVNVSDPEAVRARDAYAKSKEGKRLVPSMPEKIDAASDTLGSPSELRIVSSLNERSPATDGVRDIGSPRTNFAPPSPRILDADEQTLDEGHLLRRQTTKGRRRGGEVASLGLPDPAMEPVERLPSVGIIASSPTTRQRSNSEQDYYGGDSEERERLQQIQMDHFPAPPAAHTQMSGPYRG